MSEWVYCQSHVGPHTTGWCTVGAERQIPLGATTERSAHEEVKENGWPIFGYCLDCYRRIANERPYRTRCAECDPDAP